MPSHGNQDHEQHPEGLATAAQVFTAEDVAENPEEAHEPGEEQEEFEQCEQERAIVVEHQSALRLVSTVTDHQSTPSAGSWAHSSLRRSV